MHVANAPAAPLFGLPFSSLPCGDIQMHGNGLSGAFGGIPVYLKHAIAGGIGVDGRAGQTEDERIALAAVTKQYSVPAAITADNIYLGGIQLPWIEVALQTKFTGRLCNADAGHRHANANYPVIPTVPTSFTPATFADILGEIRIR